MRLIVVVIVAEGEADQCIRGTVAVTITLLLPMDTRPTSHPTDSSLLSTHLIKVVIHQHPSTGFRSQANLTIHNRNRNYNRPPTHKTITLIMLRNHKSIKGGSRCCRTTNRSSNHMYLLPSRIMLSHINSLRLNMVRHPSHGLATNCQPVAGSLPVVAAATAAMGSEEAPKLL
ncbi:hypothetical protein VTK73DRAFT_7243 [Phialemonium thermophilum]|uniref:Uncharacterized protein n=1 Tax=Phialemonium thermophilum TaxID=223376 RepID=A0ABR3XU67_9PEZI